MPPGGYYAQYNGNIGGLTWRSAGDGKQRKYKFTYDAANRLLNAEFNQFNPANNAFDTGEGLDFSERIGDGSDPASAYDANGNILNLRNVGFKGGSASSLIDELQYTYQPNSNKLLKVVDLIVDPNSKLGDFKESTSAGDDYAYDVNGNLTLDNNKGISTILYTHLNTPYEIRIPGKGKILYTYDNLGRKLKKEVYDSTGTSATKTTWLYMGNFVYKNDTIQFYSHEEGRARYDTTQTTGEATLFNFDYFIKDHLGNVRMVLTEEKDTIPYPTLTFEDTDMAAQNAIWENASGDSINIGSRNSRPANFGTAGTNGSYAKIVRKSTGSIGAAKLLKVMAGDRIHTSVDYFTFVANANNTGADGIGSLVTNFATSLLASTQVSAAVKAGASSLTSALSSNTFLTGILNTPNNTNSGNNAPKAYLNILFFDEQLKLDESNTTVIPVPYSVNAKATISRMAANALTAKKNGYVYVYFSNESDEILWFDNFMLTHELSSLREETHYYPFGLTMAGISSRSLGKLDNKYEYNGKELQNKEFNDGSGLEIYDFKYRFYDMQLGRFFNQDRLADKFVYMSPYQFCSNSPIWLREIDGLEGVKYTEVDKDGNKKTIVEKNIVVLTERTKTIPVGASQKQIDKITKQNAKIEQANAAKIANVKSELNAFYNGSDGKGATDSKGNVVAFKFNITGVSDIDKKGMSVKEIDAAYSKISQDNGMAAVSQFNHSIALTAPAGVLTNDFASGGVLGNTIAARIMRINFGSPDGTISHEVAHTLGLDDNGYTSGGILNSPPQQVLPSEVDEILNKAYDKQ